MTPQLLGVPMLLGHPLYGFGAEMAPEPPSKIQAWWATYRGTILGGLAIASMAASTFHGYRRNKSVGWALWWGLWGGIFPVVTPVIAAAQGFAKPKAA